MKLEGTLTLTNPATLESIGGCTIRINITFGALNQTFICYKNTEPVLFSRTIADDRKRSMRRSPKVSVLLAAYPHSSPSAKVLWLMLKSN